MIAGAYRWVFTAAFGGALAVLLGAAATAAAVLLLAGVIARDLCGWC